MWPFIFKAVSKRIDCLKLCIGFSSCCFELVGIFLVEGATCLNYMGCCSYIKLRPLRPLQYHRSLEHRDTPV